jgi:hypothetical protein
MKRGRPAPAVASRQRGCQRESGLEERRTRGRLREVASEDIIRHRFGAWLEAFSETKAGFQVREAQESNGLGEPATARRSNGLPSGARPRSRADRRRLVNGKGARCHGDVMSAAGGGEGSGGCGIGGKVLKPSAGTQEAGGCNPMNLGSAVGCNKPTKPSVEEAVMAVRNREGGTSRALGSV